MTWTVDRSKVLTKDEILTVLADLKRKARRSINTQTNLTIFRLATCCGLRASEIAGLTLDNLRLDSDSPKIRIPRTLGKGGKARTVPFFDQATLDDLRAWKAFRLSQGATGADLVVCSQHKDSLGNAIDRRNIRTRYKQACKALGRERQDEITVHHGRHSFVSHCLRAGLDVVSVQHAAGHASLGVTSIYSHLVGESVPGTVFA
jgi:site-specific recombinase XerC